MEMNYGLVTPVKNEAENLARLFKSIESQKIVPRVWLIVENGSDDGSFEMISDLKSRSPLCDRILCVQFTLPGDSYGLGWKYSTVIEHGFESLKGLDSWNFLDYLGIVDADCFPDENYFSDLIGFFHQHKDLGITSGYGFFLDGKYDGENSTWVRGNCRLWRRECFNQAGYIKGPSADSLSLAKAVSKGWKAFPNPSAKYSCREMGKKVDYGYYGYSAYYRGIPFSRIVLKSIRLATHLRFGPSLKYLSAYLKSYFSKLDRVNDPDILNYFSSQKILP
jgi:glycosyltransferase involved in cell wall biosynthesis